jgi:hypothetical protein
MRSLKSRGRVSLLLLLLYVLRLETDDVTPDPVVHPSLLLYQQEDKKKCVISWRALGFLFAAYVFFLERAHIRRRFLL